MCNDLLLKQNPEIQFFTSVNNFLLALTSTIAVTIVLYKIIEVISRNAVGDAISYGPFIVNTLKSAILIPAYNMGNWMNDGE